MPSCDDKIRKHMAGVMKAFVRNMKCQELKLKHVADSLGLRLRDMKGKVKR